MNLLSSALDSNEIALRHSRIWF